MGSFGRLLDALAGALFGRRSAPASGTSPGAGGPAPVKRPPGVVLNPGRSDTMEGVTLHRPGGPKPVPWVPPFKDNGAISGAVDGGTKAAITAAVAGASTALGGGVLGGVAAKVLVGPVIDLLSPGNAGGLTVAQQAALQRAQDAGMSTSDRTRLTASFEGRDASKDAGLIAGLADGDATRIGGSGRNLRDIVASGNGSTSDAGEDAALDDGTGLAPAPAPAPVPAPPYDLTRGVAPPPVLVFRLPTPPVLVPGGDGTELPPPAPPVPAPTAPAPTPIRRLLRPRLLSEDV